MAEVIYDKRFCQGGTEGRAVIVDYSDTGHVEFRFGITERAQPCGGKEVVTLQREVKENCSEVTGSVRQALWRDLYQEAKKELNLEIRIATDPFYDLPEREVY